jgi:hypothetical protein
VTVNGKTIATVGRGAVIGEVTYRTGHPATATVTVSDRHRAAAVRGGRPARLRLRATQTSARSLEQNLANHLRAKLTSMTADRAAAAE